MARDALKRAVEVVLLRGGAASLARPTCRRRTWILAYHNIVPCGEAPGGELPLHLPQDAFARQLEALQREYDVVPLADVLRLDGTSTRPRAAITFDDGYAGALTAGVEELARRGLPATVFVAPAFIGGRSFWWDEAAGPVGGHLPADLRGRLLTECAGDDTHVRGWARTHGLPLVETLPWWGRAASEEQLRRAAQDGLVTYGSHTWSHPNLARLDDERLHDELSRPLEWLRSRFPDRSVPWLSYPYGADSPHVQVRARALGYRAAVRAAGGRFHPGRATPMALPRYTVPAQLSEAGFALRAAGLFCR